MELIRRLTFLFIVFALVMPVPAVASAVDMQGSAHMMTMDNGETMLCDGDMGKDSNMDCKDNCASSCMSVVFPIVLSSLNMLYVIIAKSSVLLIDMQNFQSIFPENINHPPIVIS